ncbi:hypothetical protein MNBD_NITROSPINAE01-1056 [hydrothermal vent metagenome]|uniref:HTH tetR-type domain-containing protein n=1 Tax=hydrothermal vent metagenome TaxID=652676 RepID=A0A3B1C1J1_9ZZZZ
MDETREIREKIKQAAIKRFSTYGFGKTTMAEIGCDCNMSAANLYNFYKNKQDIAAATVEDHFADEHRAYKEIARQTNLAPPEKIRAFVNKSIDITAGCVKTHDKIFELLEFISKERKDLIEAHIEQKKSILAEILAEGNRTGDFNVSNILQTAHAVLKAFVYFNYPAFMVNTPEEETREIANDVVDLILKGLYTR